MRWRLFGWPIALILWFGTLNASTGDPRLLDAVRKGDAVAVSALLKERVDVNARAGDGATALHWAAYRNNPELTELLLRAGASVNATNDLGVTPLWVAAPKNSTAVVMERLLNAGANPNIVPPTGETPLMIASRTGNLDGAKLLLAHGADVNARESTKGQTALMWAVADRQPNIVHMLIEAGADLHARTVTSRRYVAVCCGEYNGDARAGAAWMEHGGFTALLFAAREGELESARLLLDAGANVNDMAADGASALALAALSGQEALAALLIDKGADLNAAGAGYTALHASVLRRDLKLAKALIARGANLNARLTKATAGRRAAIIPLATPETRGGGDKNDYAFDIALIGATPFMLAAKEGEAEFMRAFAAAGADLSIGLADGSTPLMVAAQGKQRLQVWRTLNVIPGQEVDRTPERRALAAAKVVLELGADVNAANQAGDTALHVAALKRFESVIRFLVANGAKLEAKNSRGETALAVALTPLLPPSGSQVATQGLVLKDEGPEIAAVLRKLGAQE